MKDVPVINFKIALAEINERLRVCLALSQFVEEASDLENTFGKALVKVSAHLYVCCSIQLMHDWIFLFYS